MVFSVPKFQHFDKTHGFSWGWPSEPPLFFGENPGQGSQPFRGGDAAKGNFRLLHYQNMGSLHYQAKQCTKGNPSKLPPQHFYCLMQWKSFKITRNILASLFDPPKMAFSG